MKSELTALTQPRMSSGGSSCTRDERTTTLTTLAQPRTQRGIIERIVEREYAKAMVEQIRANQKRR